MTFEDLKDRFKSEGQQLWDRIQESSTYQSLRDRYDNLSPERQKLVVWGSVALLVVILFSIPLATLQTSSEHVSEFEGKKELMRDLLRAQKEANEVSTSVANLPVAAIRAEIDRALQQLQLLPEQNRGVTVAPTTTPLVKASIIESVLEVSTMQLNLKQVVSLAASLARIQGTKLKDLVMTANTTDPRYFDTIYRLVVFRSEPPKANEPPPPPPPGRPRGRTGS